MAKKALNYPAVRFNGLQARAIGVGFANLARRDGLVVWACSILPEHVHLVIARHHRPIEKIAERLKAAATHQLLLRDLHPLGAIRLSTGLPPKCWQRGHWAVYSNSPGEICREIRYVEDNPLKERKPRQRWPFVVPYEGNCL